jgi:hypothetical protein
LDFLNWAYTDGEGEASSLDYAPLPPDMISQLKTRLGTIDFADAK